MELKLKMPNIAKIDSFELMFTPVTLDIYYAQFERDLNSDVVDCLMKYGSYTRSLTHRMIWAMCRTSNQQFMSFVEFINILEYNIYDFIEDWGKDFVNWFEPIISKDLQSPKRDA